MTDLYQRRHDQHPRPWSLGKPIRKGGIYIKDADGQAIAYFQNHHAAGLVVETVNQKHAEAMTEEPFP